MFGNSAFFPFSALSVALWRVSFSMLEGSRVRVGFWTVASVWASFGLWPMAGGPGWGGWSRAQSHGTWSTGGSKTMATNVRPDGPSGFSVPASADLILSWAR